MRESLPATEPQAALADGGARTLQEICCGSQPALFRRTLGAACRVPGPLPPFTKSRWFLFQVSYFPPLLNAEGVLKGSFSCQSTDYEEQYSDLIQKMVYPLACLLCEQPTP